jgi:hypothetical protein
VSKLEHTVFNSSPLSEERHSHARDNSQTVNTSSSSRSTVLQPILRRHSEGSRGIQEAPGSAREWIGDMVGANCPILDNLYQRSIERLNEWNDSSSVAVLLPSDP